MRRARPRRVKITRYVLPDGSRCNKNTPGARRVKVLSETWYATLTIDGRKRRLSLGTDDEGTAWVNLRKLQRQRADQAAGIVDRSQEHAAKSLLDHVQEWQEVLAAKGTSPGQVQLLGSRVRRLAELAGWKRLTDLTADSCWKVLARLMKEPYHQGRPLAEAAEPNRKGVSAQTRNHYLSSLKQFAAWCEEGGRLSRSPVRQVKPITVESDRRHDRRSPSDEEIGKLFEALARPDCPVRTGMSGPQRALGYKVAMATGFRAGEIRSLSRPSFDLDAGTVTVRASYSKRRRRDTQQLPPWLVDELRTWFEGGGKCWERLPLNHPGHQLIQDLELAGIDYAVTDPDGHPLYFDYHALRHWFVSWAANLPGISPKTLMSLCRHSTPTLTLKVYAKAKREDVRAAVNQMPRPREGESLGQG